VAAALRRDRSLEVWRPRFERIGRSAFLCGRKTDFIARFLWALGPKNVAKVEAGNYDDRQDFAGRMEKESFAIDGFVEQAPSLDDARAAEEESLRRQREGRAARLNGERHV
jgi:hypothetical protein